MGRIRLDVLLTDKGLVASRSRARSTILSGNVLVNDVPVDKAGASVDEDADIRIRGTDHPYVSRGGVKLKGALDAFRVSPEGLTVLDVGASTGGFTDCCLKLAASHVIAVDVGYGQLHWSLRRDPRVTVIERTNARYLKPDDIETTVDLAVIDVSFISLEKILPAVSPLVAPSGCIIALVKPQFEAGRELVSKGGVVKDRKTRDATVAKVIAAAEELRLDFIDSAESVLPGPKGNIETFIYLVKPEQGQQA